MLPLFARKYSITAFVVLALGLSAAIAGAADWKGKEVTKDGALHIMNPAAPMIPADKRDATEVWRAGGDDDEDVLFGIIGDITMDSDGNTYLLDMQLSEVHVISPNGEFLRTIGREGEGPGEFRRPRSILRYADGSIGVMQAMPGRIVLLTTDGEPAGNQPIPEGKDGSRMMVSGGQLAGEHLVLMTGEFARSDAGMEITNTIMGVGKDGSMTAKYWSSVDKMSMAGGMVFDEKKRARPTWTVTNSGQVLINDNFDAYAINVYSADGTLERVVEREYTHRKRSAAEKEQNKPRVMIRGHGGDRSPETIASDTDRDLMAIFAREDGTVWVLSSKGRFDIAKGTIGTFDVFDKDGRFTRQITVAGQFTPGKDRMYIQGDFVFVVTGAVDAERTMWGMGEQDEMEDEDAEPMQVICYDMTEIVRAMR